MGKFNTQFEEMIMKEENALEEIYKAKLVHLDNELSVRLALGDEGFKSLDPKFSYENTPEHIEHCKQGLKLTIEEEKAKVMSALNNVTRSRLNREEMKEIEEERMNSE